MVWQKTAAEGVSLLAPLGFSLDTLNTTELASTSAVSSTSEINTLVEDLYNTFSTDVHPALELNAQATQPLSWLTTLQALFPLDAAEPLNLTAAPVATLARVLQAAEVLRQLDRLAGTSEQASRLLATLGLDPAVAPVLGGRLSELASLTATLDWRLYNVLQANERLLARDLTTVGQELLGALRQTLTLTERPRFGLGLAQLQAVTLTPTAAFDAAQLLRALEGLALTSPATALLELAARLTQGLVSLDALRLGLTVGLQEQAGLDPAALADVIRGTTARELMALGATPALTLELPLRLAEALRQTSLAAPVVGALVSESLGLVGNALAEVYFGARAAEALALDANPALALEVRRAASELVVLAETVGFGANWALAEQLVATLLASPDAVQVLRALEGFAADDALTVLAELTQSLRERWAALSAAGLIFGLRAETATLLGDQLTPALLRWLPATERLHLAARNTALVEVTAQLQELTRLAERAGLVFRWSAAETLGVQETLTPPTLSLTRLNPTLRTSDTARPQLELLITVAEQVLDLAETVGFVTRLALIETLLAQALASPERAALLLRALEGLTTRDLATTLAEINAPLAERWRLAERAGTITRFLAELQLLFTASTSPAAFRQLLVAERLQLLDRTPVTAELTQRLTELSRLAAGAGVRFAFTATEATTLAGPVGLTLRVAPLRQTLGLAEAIRPQAELVVTLAAQILRLAEAPSFVARLALAEQLLATTLLNPNTADILRALEGFTTGSMAEVLLELAPELAERWRLAERSGALLRVLLEAQWLCGDTAALDALRWLSANSTLGLTTTSPAAVELVARLEAVYRLAETVGLVFAVSTETGVALTSQVPGLVLRLEALRQTLGVSTTTALNLELAARLLEALVALEVAGAVQGLTAEETLALADQLTRALWAQLSAPSTLALTDELAQTLTVITSAALTTDDAATALLEVLAHAETGLAFIGRLPLDEGDYQAWVVNTDSLGVTQYTQFAFNSLANHQGVPLGLTETGLYELVGADDDGEDIVAHLSTGELNLGSLTRKNVPRAYLYLQQDGDLLLRTSAIDSGHRREYLYRVELTPALGSEPTTRRIALGRGLRAVSWAFELHNVDGADFDLRGAEILPVILSLRE